MPRFKHKATKKKAFKKKATKRKATRRRPITKAPAGYKILDSSGLAVPESAAKAISPSKMRDGIGKASKAISRILEDLASSVTDGFEVKEIELTASFSAEGKFLGFGVGGATSITFRVGPSR